MIPYYDEDGITIYHGDCRDVLPSLTFGSVITDPPYGMGHYETDQVVLTTELLSALARAPLALFGYPERLVELCVKAGLTPTEWVTWWPTNAAIRAFGLAGLLKEAECVAVFGPHRFGDLRQPRESASSVALIDCFVTRDDAVGRGRLSHGDRLTRRLGDVWTEASPGLAFNSHQRQHPNEKPMGVMRRLVEGIAVGTVLDPFMGSGTTLRAAKDLGRHAIGVEIEERYCEIAAKRLAQGVLDFGSAS